MALPTDYGCKKPVPNTFRSICCLFSEELKNFQNFYRQSDSQFAMRGDMTFWVRPGHFIVTLMVSFKGASCKGTAALLADPTFSVTDVFRNFLSLYKLIHTVSVSIAYISIPVVQASMLSLRFFSQLQWLMEVTPFSFLAQSRPSTSLSAISD